MENIQKIQVKKFQKYYNTYLNILMEYRDDNGWFLDKKKSSIHTVPFLLTVASALECSLNDYIIEHYSNKYKDDIAKILITGLLSMTVKGKLQNIVPLLTSNKYIINTNHKTYHILIELIKMRNNLVHNKSIFTIHELFIKTDLDGKKYLEPDSELLTDIEKEENLDIDYSLGIKRNIGDYHDALDQLHELFFSIYKDDNFCANELIVKLEKIETNTLNIHLEK
jgi:hypothetical protein